MDGVVEKIMAAVAAAAGAETALGGSLKIDFGEPGSILIDGTAGQNAIGDGAGKVADCTVKLSLETLMAMRAGTLDPAAAFFKGKLKVSGDFALAMKLGPILQQAQG